MSEQFEGLRKGLRNAVGPPLAVSPERPSSVEDRAHLAVHGGAPAENPHHAAVDRRHAGASGSAV
jgi:hypothetical protein